MNMVEDHIHYDQLIDGAMRKVVKDALVKISKEGLPGEHHFLISFLTGFEGVSIPAYLKKQYPDEMTIVIQHQYEDLKVTDDYFEIVLSFEGSKDRIKVPYSSLTSFADPGVRFGLKFNILSDEAFLEDLLEEEINLALEEEAEKPQKGAKKKKETKAKATKSKKKSKAEDTNVVALDSFRKK